MHATRGSTRAFKKRRDTSMTESGGSPIGVVLLGARFPEISGSGMTMREMERTFEADPEIELTIIDLSGIRGKGVRGACRYVARLWGTCLAARHADEVFLFTIGSGLPWTLLPVWMISALTRTVLAVRCGGGSAHAHGGRVRQALVRFLLRRASVYIVQTKLLRDHAHSVGLEQAVAIPNGRHLADAVRSDHPHRRKWVSLGRLCPTKGVIETVQAFGRMPGLSLDLIGPFSEGLERTDLTLPSNVAWLGSKPPEEIPALLAEYDGMVFPSYYDTEGHAGVLIEGMAAGLPIVTTRHMALPEVVDETCALLIPVEDVDAIVEAVSRIDSDPDLRKRLGEGGPVRAKEFEWHTLTERCKNLVVDAVRSRRR